MRYASKDLEHKTWANFWSGVVVVSGGQVAFEGSERILDPLEKLVARPGNHEPNSAKETLRVVFGSNMVTKARLLEGLSIWDGGQEHRLYCGFFETRELSRQIKASQPVERDEFSSIAAGTQKWNVMYRRRRISSKVWGQFSTGKLEVQPEGLSFTSDFTFDGGTVTKRENSIAAVMLGEVSVRWLRRPGLRCIDSEFVHHFSCLPWTANEIRKAFRAMVEQKNKD